MPELVFASYISLKTIITTQVITENYTNIRVEMMNSGDEPAYSVQVSPLLLDNFQVEPDLFNIGTLNINSPESVNFNVTVSNQILPGTYPLVVLVDYTDANGYPFSSVSPSFIVHRTQTNSIVTGSMKELTLSGKKTETLTLTIMNLDEVQHNVDVKLYLPRELKADKDKSTVLVGPKEEKNLNFQVSSFSALTGSNYVILATLDYEDSNYHYSSAIRSMIKIVAEKSLEFPIWLPILIFIGLLIIFVYYLIGNKKMKVNINPEKEKSLP